MDNIKLIETFIITISALAALYNVRLVAISIKKDHERRSKQATFEYVGENIRNTLTAIDEKVNFKKISNGQCQEIFNSNKESTEMLRLLGTLEHISVGVNTGIYDKETLFLMSSSYIIDIYDKIEPYIMYLRKNLSLMGKPTEYLYIEFEKLATDFKKRTC